MVSDWDDDGDEDISGWSDELHTNLNESWGDELDDDNIHNDNDMIVPSANNNDNDTTHKKYKLHSRQSMEIMIDRYTNELCDILNIDPYDSLLLLVRYDYNINHIISLWSIDEQSTRKQSGISELQANTPVHTSKKPHQSIACQLCYSDIDDTDSMIRLKCTDRYCNDCWLQWIISQHSDRGAAALRIKCIGECTLFLPIQQHIQFISQYYTTQQLQVQQWLINSFITAQRTRYIHCIGTDCKSIIESLQIDSYIGCIECQSCNTTYCFHCQQVPHDPCNCQTAKLWLEKNQSESENVLWISANTKPCPKCNSPVEKNGGC